MNVAATTVAIAAPFYLLQPVNNGGGSLWRSPCPFWDRAWSYHVRPLKLRLENKRRSRPQGCFVEWALPQRLNHSSCSTVLRPQEDGRGRCVGSHGKWSGQAPVPQVGSRRNLEHSRDCTGSAQWLPVAHSEAWHSASQGTCPDHRWTIAKF